MNYRKILWHALAATLFVVGGAMSHADVPISALPAGTTLSGTEAIPAVQTAVTVKTTPAAISTYVQGQILKAGSTAGIGGIALLAGECTSGTASITGATTLMAAVASPVTYPGDGAVWSAQITSSGTVTVRVCAIAPMTPTSSIYRVRVLL